MGEKADNVYMAKLAEQARLHAPAQGARKGIGLGVTSASLGISLRVLTSPGPNGTRLSAMRRWLST